MRQIAFLLIRDRIGRLRLEYIIVAASVAAFLAAVGLSALY